MYFNLSGIIGNNTITDGSHDNGELVRTATISQKHKVMVLTFHRDQPHQQVLLSVTYSNGTDIEISWNITLATLVRSSNATTNGTITGDAASNSTAALATNSTAPPVAGDAGDNSTTEIEQPANEPPSANEQPDGEEEQEKEQEEQEQEQEHEAEAKVNRGLFGSGPPRRGLLYLARDRELGDWDRALNSTEQQHDGEEQLSEDQQLVLLAEDGDGIPIDQGELQLLAKSEPMLDMHQLIALYKHKKRVRVSELLLRSSSRPCRREYSRQQHLCAARKPTRLLAVATRKHQRGRGTKAAVVASWPTLARYVWLVAQARRCAVQQAVRTRCAQGAGAHAAHDQQAHHERPASHVPGRVRQDLCQQAALARRHAVLVLVLLLFDSPEGWSWFVLGEKEGGRVHVTVLMRCTFHRSTLRPRKPLPILMSMVMGTPEREERETARTNAFLHCLLVLMYERRQLIANELRTLAIRVYGHPLEGEKYRSMVEQLFSNSNVRTRAYVCSRDSADDGRDSVGVEGVGLCGVQQDHGGRQGCAQVLPR